MEYIGQVKFNLDYYKGNDLYSDGDRVEEELLEICKAGRVREALLHSDKWSILYHLSEIRGNIIDWYPFKKGAHILEIGSGCGAVSGFLCQRAERVVGIELSKRRSLINAYRNRECSNLEIMIGNFKDIDLDERFDYITLIGVLEYAANYIEGESPYIDMLRRVKKYLKKDGKIIIAIENKMGLKYWNGANEDHLGKRFKGLEDYRNIANVRTFSKPELIDLLGKCGIGTYKFYYPLPDYKLPFAIYSDEYLPRMGDVRTWEMNYSSIRMGMFNEGIVADQICKDRVFDYFSNSFLVVCNESGNDIQFACYNNGQRIDKYQMRTLISKKENMGSVKKSFMKKGAQTDTFVMMRKSYEILNDEFPNVEFVQPHLIDEGLIYEYVDGVPLDVVLSEKVHNYNDLVSEFRQMINKYMSYNEKMVQDFVVTDKYISFFGNNAVATQEKSLVITNLDMQLSNLIAKDNKVYGIDYEWLVDFPVPFEYALYRCINNFWNKFSMYFSASANRNNFLVALGIKEKNIKTYNAMGKMFANRIFGTGASAHYLQNYKKQSGVIEWRSC